MKIKFIDAAARPVPVPVYLLDARGRSTGLLGAREIPIRRGR